MRVIPWMVGKFLDDITPHLGHRVSNPSKVHGLGIIHELRGRQRAYRDWKLRRIHVCDGVIGNVPLALNLPHLMAPVLLKETQLLFIRLKMTNLMPLESAAV